MTKKAATKAATGEKSGKAKPKAAKANKPLAYHRDKGQDKTPSLPSAFLLFDASWQALKNNAGSIVGLVLMPFLASIPVFFIVILLAYGAASVDSSVSGADKPLGVGLAVMLVYLAMSVIVIIASAGMVVATISAARGKKTKFTEALKQGSKNFWRYFGLNVCISIVVLIGLVLLIVPGLFMLRRYFLAPYYLIDRKLGVFEAMEQSAAEAKRFGGIWDMLGVIFLICLLSFIPVIGTFVSLAFSVLYLCAPAIRYIQISKAAGYEPSESRV